MEGAPTDAGINEITKIFPILAAILIATPGFEFLKEKLDIARDLINKCELGGKLVNLEYIKIFLDWDETLVKLWTKMGQVPTVYAYARMVYVLRRRNEWKSDEDPLFIKLLKDLGKIDDMSYGILKQATIKHLFTPSEDLKELLKKFPDILEILNEPVTKAEADFMEKLCAESIPDVSGYDMGVLKTMIEFLKNLGIDVSIFSASFGILEAALKKLDLNIPFADFKSQNVQLVLMPYQKTDEKKVMTICKPDLASFEHQTKTEFEHQTKTKCENIIFDDNEGVVKAANKLKNWEGVLVDKIKLSNEDKKLSPEEQEAVLMRKMMDNHRFIFESILDIIITKLEKMLTLKEL